MTRSNINTNRKAAGVVAFYGTLLVLSAALVLSVFSSPAKAQIVPSGLGCQTAFELMSSELALVHNTKIDEALAEMTKRASSLSVFPPGSFDEIITITQSQDFVLIYLLKDGKSCNVVPAPRDDWLEIERSVWGLAV